MLKESFARRLGDKQFVKQFSKNIQFKIIILLWIKLFFFFFYMDERAKLHHI